MNTKEVEQLLATRLGPIEAQTAELRANTAVFGREIRRLRRSTRVLSLILR